MSLNETPSGERIHIGFFGRRNAGKSSLVNRVTGQSLAVVSPEKGTTTDPVYKAMELLPLGPVMIIDTPGSDDVGELGGLRVEKTMEILGKTDIAVLVIDASVGLTGEDRELTEMFEARKIPYIIACNKSDKLNPADAIPAGNSIYVSALTGEGVKALKERIGALADKDAKSEHHLVADLLSPGDQIVLVIPIDESAPKGRIILPQQQVIRDALEAGALITVSRETELAAALAALKEAPALVITDSQAFRQVAEIVPENVPLTSFSILMARYKGFLDTALSGVSMIETLQDGDKVLIAEGCTHHRQCRDIGTVKIPGWLKAHSGHDVTIETCSGREFPTDLTKYRLVIHCGGCMLNEREVVRRMQVSVAQGVPFLNYGVFIAYVNGILKRSVAAVPHNTSFL
jgi:[FeFe] hydrogenase H-cluster maturation GTPase HydF